MDSITIYYKDKKFKKAIKFGEFILADYDKKLIAKNEGYVNTISWLTWLCEEDNDTIKKEKYYKLLEDNIRYIGNNFQYLIQNYYVIGNNYRIKKNYDLAEEYFKKTIKLSEQEHIEKEAYFYSLQFLGQIYSQKEKSILFSDKTKNIFDKQLILSEKLYGNKSFEYSFALTNLGSYYSQKEDFAQAEIYFSKASALIETIYGKADDKYLVSIDNLVNHFIGINNIPKADYYNQIGLEIVINKYGKFHKDYLSFLANKAFIKHDLGQYNESQNIYNECIGLAKDLYGRESEIYGTMLSNSVFSFLGIGGSYQNAEKLLLIDHNITKKIFGENNLKFAMSLNRLSMVYYSLKLDEKSIQYNLKALKIIVNTIGKNNSNYGIVCSALGTQYAITNDFVNAEKYYLESYNVKMILYGENNLARIVNLKNVLDFYNKCERYTATKKYLFEYFRLLKYNLLEMQNNFGQNDLLNFTKKYYLAILIYQVYIFNLTSIPTSTSVVTKTSYS